MPASRTSALEAAVRRRVAMVWEDFQSASAIAHLVGERRSRRIRRKGGEGIGGELMERERSQAMRMFG